MTISADMNEDYNSLCKFIDESTATKAIDEIGQHLNAMQKHVSNANGRSRHPKPDLSGFIRAIELVRIGNATEAKKNILHSITEYDKFVAGIPRQFR